MGYGRTVSAQRAHKCVRMVWQGNAGSREGTQTRPSSDLVIKMRFIIHQAMSSRVGRVGRVCGKNLINLFGWESLEIREVEFRPLNQSTG